MVHAYLCYHDHFQRTIMVFEFIILNISSTITVKKVFDTGFEQIYSHYIQKVTDLNS